ncbi:MAG TPA: vanadium-dependent haloperoxidase [Verrucomicrobiae bacterium]|nr:vanadium-dependent haloperoxidase [Verrucomicrobiae bacterium]
MKAFRLKNFLFLIVTPSVCVAAMRAHGAASNSIARVWNERAFAAGRVDTTHPPAQARNYFSLSVCMYDAWAAYDPVAIGYVYRDKHTAPDIAAARSNAISYAAFRMLIERHVYSRTAFNTLVLDTNLFISLGFSPTNTTRDTSTPIGVGNTIYDKVSLWFSNDGSRQTNGTPYNPAQPSLIPNAYPDYPVGDPRRYVYVNPALAVYPNPETMGPCGLDDGFGNGIVDVNHWQRLNVVTAVDDNGFPASVQQRFLGAQWFWVRPFSLTRPDENSLWNDPGPPPYFGGATHAQFIHEIVEDIRASSQLTVADGVTIDISPGVYGNNSLDDPPAHYEFPNIYDGHGHTNNPATGLPYGSNLVKRGDYARALSEFWADGPNSGTPPGHWNVVANDMSDSPSLVKRIGGTGPIVDDLEWDVKMYLALNAATHDAACACWALKRFYDGWRPISAIRYVGGLGQSSYPSLPSYNVRGLPLISNLIELVTASSVSSGRHAGLTPGKIAVLGWPGETPQRAVPNGVHWMQAECWTTYQRSNYVVPAFPGYFSGHSTFSRSAAEVLTALTGSEYFPGGIITYTITNLANEKGPSAPVPLQYATYYDAADAAGMSRIWGGIHPHIDNLAGRRAGAEIGKGVWALVKKYWDGSVTNTPITLAVRKLNSSNHEVRFNTLRGLYYKLQSKTDFSSPFADNGGGLTQTMDTVVIRTNATAGAQEFYRAVSSPTP